MLSLTDPERGTRQYFGKYSGEVMDHETDLPQANALRGDIRVKVPGILEEDGSGAARPLQVIAKPSFHPGFFFIPEVGEKVWVEFVAGEIDHPIWTGIWYPDDKSPGTIDDARPTRFQKVIRTASGHVVQLDDTSDNQAITVLHAVGAQVKIDKNGSVLVANQKGTFLFLNADAGETTLLDEHGNLLTFTKDAAVVSAKDGTSVQITAGVVAINAKDKIQLTAKDVILDSGTVSLGKGAALSAVVGEELLASLLTHTHGGPGSPPVFAPLLGPAPAGKGLSSSVKVAG
jgi:uncharacterized protein involved in type VI secretion and phage assembly